MQPKPGKTRELDGPCCHRAALVRTFLRIVTHLDSPTLKIAPRSKVEEIVTVKYGGETTGKWPLAWSSPEQ
jgi:hypothetical protein